MIDRVGRRLIAALVAAAAGLLVLEIAFRAIDQQPLTRLALVSRVDRPDRAGSAAPDLRYVDRVPRAHGIERSWYLETPPPRPRIPLDAQLAARAARYPTDPYTPFFAFNRRYLAARLCGSRRDAPGNLDEFFFFDGIGDAYPTYRHLPHISPPSWFVTNNFGWRGADIGLSRPADVVRIAFVGASTTVDSYSVPFSHPELVEHWLNDWATARGASYRFEVINAGRTGIDSRSIAAIVQQELVPVDPDLVIFYEGANQFTPGGLMHAPLKYVFPRPTTTFRERTSLEGYSALLRRVLSAWDRVKGGSGAEPPKPPASVSWPDGVDELAPDPHDPRLPMDLPQVTRDLDAMRSALAQSGGELAVSSFIWLAQPGMVLDLRRHAAIYRYLNDTLWPIPYRHVRRLADFQNRVFAAYARDSRIAFIDIDREYPRDPDLFDDPIHLNYAGLRLQGWMFLQSIARIADRKLASGQWPRPVRQHATVHPAFAEPERRLATAADIAARCS